jgi:hypothetical protein
MKKSDFMEDTNQHRRRYSPKTIGVAQSDTDGRKSDTDG